MLFQNNFILHVTTL